MNKTVTGLLSAAIMTGLMAAQNAKAQDSSAPQKDENQMTADKNGCNGKKHEDKNSCSGKANMKKKKKSDKNSCKNGCGESKEKSTEEKK